MVTYRLYLTSQWL